MKEKESRLLTVIFAVVLGALLLSASIAAPILCRPFYYAHIDALHLTETTPWTEEEIRQLRRACDTFVQTTRTQDAVRIAQADVALHDIIVRASGNDRLIQMVGNLSQQMYRYRLEYIKDVSQHGRLIEEHEEIYRCIRSRDREAGAKAIGEDAMEKLLEDGINKIGLGPQGMGGKYSVMGVHIENTARHPSTIGVAVNTGCWSHRRGHIIFDKDLNYEITTHSGVTL